MEQQGRARGRARGRRQDRPAGQPAPAVAPVAAAAAATTTATATRPASTLSTAGSDNSSGNVPPVGRATGARSRNVDPAASVARQMRGLNVRSEEASTSASTSAPRSAASGGNGNGNGSSSDNGNGKPKSGPVGRYGIRQGLNISTKPQGMSSKMGSSGQPVKIQTNHFKVETVPNWSLNHYHVDFNPAEDRTFFRKVLLRVHEKAIGRYMFDGTSLFTCTLLSKDNKPKEFFSERTSDNERIRITIKKVGTVEPGDHQYLQLFNIILRECSAKMNLQLIRRNYFDKEAAIKIQDHRLELWPGYITAMGRYEYNNILLQAEIVYKVLRQDSAYDLFREIYTQSGDRGFQTAFSSIIIGTVVMTRYNDKTYRVDDVSYSDTPQSTFPAKTRDGVKHISYKEYFESKYGCRINDLRQPMLISRTSNRERRAGMPELVYLVPELCIMTGLNDNMRSNFTLMKAVAAHTSVAPSDRIRRLEAYNQRLVNAPDVRQKLKDWGLSLSPRLVEVGGRILPSENIQSGSRIFESGPDVDWTRNLRSAKMLKCVDLQKWILVFPSKLDQAARNLARMMKEVGNGMSFNIAYPNEVSLQSDYASAYVQDIDRAINQHNPQLVVCLVPNNRSDRYSAIKKKCILEKPVPSQVILSKNVLAKSAMSIVTKLCIQINCKIGGAPWAVGNPLASVMVIGFDVCHDTRNKSKSYGAMVASMDPSLGSYFSALTHHSTGDELSSSFHINIIKAVNNYRSRHGKLPEPIIIYRDGVGEGDLATVFETELEHIKSALTPLYTAATKKLRLAFVVVTKRLNTRLFFGGKNPSPGTVVDDIVTNPLRYDFFLVSQSVRQGTVMPTHYNVLFDSTGLPVDHMQRFAYKMTHLYYNWSGTVRVPAPCQYAHKLAFLTAQSLGSTKNEGLDELLYFL